jgi:L-threonylcarbamoyladenylate synthase
LPVEVLKISPKAPESDVVDYAAGFIRRGEVVGVPTDTFYGLSADPFNLAAIEAVFQAKGRPETKALPILVSSIEQAVTLMREVPDIFLLLAHKFWPGALTLVVEATHRNSPIPTAIISAAGGPITGTSANLSGFPSCTNAAEIVKQLGTRLPLILDAGDTGAVLASTIVRIDGDHWTLAREGALPEADIQKALKGGSAS